MNEKIKKLIGSNMDIDFSNKNWGDSVCPWNAADGTDGHKCAVKNTSICKYFCGIQYLDSVLCSYPYKNVSVLEKNDIDRDTRKNDILREENANAVLNKAKKFIHRYARPLDLARWQYHFENGTRDAVLDVLKEYQNEDGGFGHGLEADCFNPNSSPIQTWAATEILREIGFADNTHPIVKGILQYLSSGLHFDVERHQWLNTVPSNNDYPHAIWWTYKEGDVEFKYNPTAYLSGFFIRYGDRTSEFYDTAVKIAREAYQFWIYSMPYAEQHVTACFIRLYEYCSQAGVKIADMDVFRQKLANQVRYELCSAADKWETDYVCMPSNFVETKNSIFYNDNTDLVAKECAHIKTHQLEDGSFPVMWQWWTDYKEFETSKIWWKSDFCIKNLRFLREFGR